MEDNKFIIAKSYLVYLERILQSNTTYELVEVACGTLEKFKVLIKTITEIVVMMWAMIIKLMVKVVSAINIFIIINGHTCHHMSHTTIE